MKNGSELQLPHSRNTPLVTITVTEQWDQDLWLTEIWLFTWLFHVSNYTSPGTDGDDSQSLDHCIDSLQQTSGSRPQSSLSSSFIMTDAPVAHRSICFQSTFVTYCICTGASTHVNPHTGHLNNQSSFFVLFCCILQTDKDNTKLSTSTN